MTRNFSVSLIVGSAVLGGVVCGSAFAAEPDASLYVGVKTCGMCHKKDETGNQLAKWQEGPHAKAYQTLATPEAKAAGEKVGVADPQTSGKCLKCHSTAYNWTESVATDKILPSDGVTCESCHGPGKNYKSKAVMEDKAKSIAAGMVDPPTKNCTLCHNDQSPTFKGFNVDEYVKKIAHPNPQAKK